MSDSWKREVDDAVADATGRQGVFDKDREDVLGKAATDGESEASEGSSRKEQAMSTKPATDKLIENLESYCAIGGADTDNADIRVGELRALIARIRAEQTRCTLMSAVVDHSKAVERSRLREG